MLIRKRNGIEVEFDSNKIVNAISRANDSLINKSDKISKTRINEIARKITEFIHKNDSILHSVEDIQDLVEEELIHLDKSKLAKNYITYRYEHEKERKYLQLMDKAAAIIDNKSDEVEGDNANKPNVLVPCRRDYLSGLVCKELSYKIFDPELLDYHKKGIIHIHDTDYSVLPMHNCDLIDLEDMLQNGTVIGNTYIEKPHSFRTACTVASQIVCAASFCQYGGLSITLKALAPFIDISRKNLRKKVINELKDLDIPNKSKLIKNIVNSRLLEEISNGVQTLQYQFITLSNASQSPFITVFMYLNEVPDSNKRLKADLALLIEEVLRQRLKGVQCDDGHYISPVFPKLIYVLSENNIHESSKYFYLTRLAAECTAKRMVPDYVSEKVMMKVRGDCFTSMGCRSQISVWYPKDHPEFVTDETKSIDKTIYNKCIDGKWHNINEPLRYSRFNIGVCTINLPDIALSALSECGYDVTSDSINKENFYKSDKNLRIKFNKIFEDRLEICHRVLEARYNHVKNITAETSPILWMHGALARLQPKDKIEPLLQNGHSTVSLGYIGLAETVRSLTGQSHTSEFGRKLGMDIMQKLHDTCTKWNSIHNIGYSLYGTPSENYVTKATNSLEKRFPGNKISSKGWITNSYHIPVDEKIDAFSKLTKEAPFQELSSGGNISYIEVPPLFNNINALITVMRHIYNTNIYAEINTKLDYCKECGYEGEIISVTTDNGNFIWECPKCHTRDGSKLVVIRRICGYIAAVSKGYGTGIPSKGRMNDITNRVTHL